MKRLLLLSLAWTAPVLVSGAKGVEWSLVGPSPLSEFPVAGGEVLRPGHLPAGALEAGGVEFVLPEGVGATFVPGRDEERVLARPDAPQEVDRIVVVHAFVPGVGVADHRLAIAQAHRNVEALPEPLELARYVVQYEDGEEVKVAVRWGESVEDVQRAHVVPPLLWAREALERPWPGLSQDRAVAFVARYPNPRPGRRVTALRVEGPSRPGRPPGTLLVLGVGSVSGTETGRAWFVDPTPVGDDAGEGTWERPLATIQEAFDRLQPGDTAYLRGGHYALSRAAVLRGKGGEPGRWLTLSAYPGETPVIDGRGVLYDPRLPRFNGQLEPGPPYQSDTGVIAVRDIPGGWVRIQGLTVRNSLRSGISAHGIFLWADRATRERPRGLELGFNTTERTREIGLNVKDWDEVDVVGNVVIRAHSEAMVFATRGDKRHGLELPQETPMGLRHHGQEAIDLSRNRDWRIRFNVVSGGGKEAIDVISVEDGEIAWNLVHASLNGIYIDAWGEPIRGVRVHHNFIHDAFNGVSCSTEGSGDLIDFDIHHNVVVNPHLSGVSVGEATYKAHPAALRRLRVRSNTVHRPGYHAAAIGWGAYGIGVSGFPDNPSVEAIDVRDNVVTEAAHTPYRLGYGAPARHQVTFVANLAWPSEDRLPDGLRVSASGRVWEAVPVDPRLAVDPLYRDPVGGDFRPSPGSPAIGAGTDGSTPGALGADTPWRPGLDWAGRVTAFHQGDVTWRPIAIPRELCTLHRNHLQRPRFFQEGRYGEDLQQLPEGTQALGGVVWRIHPERHEDRPSLVAAGGRQAEGAPLAVRGLPVGLMVGRLAFLHAAHLADGGAAERDGTPVAAYVIHRADGTSDRLELVPGRDVAHWTGEPVDLARATLAWCQPTVLRRDRVSWSRLHRLDWVNPRPEVPVTVVDLEYVGDPALGSVALFALSAGLLPGR